MRTFTLLIALLVALQTQAEPLQRRAEEVLDQEQLGEDDQDMSISFGRDESSDLQDADVKSGLTCYCRLRGCGFRECLIGFCRFQNTI
ncbi:neutrophil antibiotic peptide NP-2-like [Peromyscus californicus insignis]|uniref:neutrophil antibiotic peptide NP-2-like n=1 Tax=Peromyscus californicus insignis TaxID=564181 RepID=UPI0022A662D1|nr:neutrophil antibiotic peptide NP-2-like [Peromyscus californicus insignis]